MSSQQPHAPERQPGRGLRWLYFLASIAAIYAITYFVSASRDADFECITDDWCVEATAAIAALRTALFLLIPLSVWIAFRLIRFAISIGHFWTFGGAVLLLTAIAGGVAYALVVAPEERLEFIHIPILGAVFGALGAFFVYWNFKQRGKAGE